MRYSEFKTRDLAEYLAKKTVIGMNKSPLQINNGDCYTFAVILSKKLNGSEIVDTTGIDGCFPSHAAVKYKGKFYDAENPEGVASLQELTYNKRMIAVMNGDAEALETLHQIGKDSEYDPRNPYW